MKKTFALVPVVLLLAAAPVVAVELLFDNFESYANTSAMQVNWSADQNGVGVLVTDDPKTGDPGKSMFFDGGSASSPQTSNNRLFEPTTPSDTVPIIWEFDFYDDGIGNKRIAGGLRTDGGGQPLESILEMGRYNAPGNPEFEPNDPPWPEYAVRTVFVGGVPVGNGVWLTLRTSDSTPAVEEGWHHFKATIKASEILFELFLEVDDPADPNEVSYASRLITTSDGAQPYNVARLGGPSNLWSAGGGGNFDNVMIYTDESSPTLFGDVDLNGVVDPNDVDDFLDRELNGPYQIEADMNEDGVVNGLDIPGFITAVQGSGAGAMAIPEPSTLILLVAGMLLLAGVRLYPCRSG